MRPLRLEMNGFGPFAGQETIDFERLSGRDLFLIEGPTGAGKTTILDGVCFALYGMVPGPRREAMGELRSTLSAPADLTSVTLDFALGDRRYRVRRVPQQERPKKRGEGTTTQMAEAALFDIGDGRERPLCKSNVIDVDAHVKELLGLSLEQFKQVLLLPQGEFRAFLLAGSADKEKLLEQIFGTGLYKEVTESLRRERLDLEATVKRERARQVELLEELDCATALAVDERASALTGRIADLQRESAAAQAAVTAARDALALLEKTDDAFRRHELARKRLDEERAREPALADAREALAAAERVAPMAEAFARQAGTARELTKAQALVVRARDAREASAQAAEAMAKQADELPELELQLDGLARRVVELETLESRHGTELAELRELERQVAADVRELPGMRHAVTADRARLEAAEAELVELRRAREAGLAAELAAGLVAGEPCPTCGSKEHPAPAQGARGGGAVELGKKEAAIAELRKRVDATTVALVARNAQAAARAERKDALVAALGDVAGGLGEQRLRTAAARDTLAARIQKLRGAVERAAADLQAAEATLAQRAEDARLRELDASEATSELERLAREREYADAAAALAARLDDARMRELRDQLADARERLAVATARAVEAAADVKGRVRPDLAAAQAGLAAADGRCRGLQAELARAGKEQEVLAAARRKLAKLAAELEVADAELRVRGRLATVLSGENPRKLSLQRFVLASRMDEVAVAASERLVRMSRGRYVLRRTDDVRHKGRGAGLELEVEDRHTGHTRSVNSLSGGEMFLASLSLALGLADVVTRRTGAVRLDALFVDEGFGTLDDETLDQVVRTLEDLRAGGRLVGVISHVAELKERITTRIAVRPGPRGSHAHVQL